MIKLIARLSFVALIATAAIYGCGKNSSPTAPTTESGRRVRSLQLEVQACGEVTYLTDLSALLPVWQDSIGAWVPGLTLGDPPAFTGGSVSDYLGALVPVLQQWQAAVNTSIGSAVLAAVPDFHAASDTTQVYLSKLSPILASWETSAETSRGRDFLPTPPTFAPDTFAPEFACPSDTTFACADSVVLNFEVVALDDCDPAPVVVSDPPSGSTFRTGTTLVTSTATDASGNVSTCTFNVTVAADTTAPVLACPGDTTITCAPAEGIAVAFSVTATGGCSAPVVTSTPSSGSVFPVGTTTVTTTATGAGGQVSTCSFNVTVEAADVTIAHAAASPSVLWPPNHKMVDISFDLEVDSECAAGPSTVTVLGVTSNEPVNGKGDGNTSPDWIIGEGGHLKLRAERSGNGNGRVYTIRLGTANDSGAGDTTTVRVVVPHDQGNGVAQR